MVEGCNHPMGPLHLTDLIGLDTTMAVADSLYAEFKEPLYVPPPCCPAWSKPGCWAARPAAASTTTPSHERPGAGGEGGPRRPRPRRQWWPACCATGYEVIYTGLFQTPDTVAAAAVDEDVDAIGLSMLSGAHLTLAPRVVEKVRDRGADIPVIVGGIIPEPDVPLLTTQGWPPS